MAASRGAVLAAIAVGGCANIFGLDPPVPLGIDAPPPPDAPRDSRPPDAAIQPPRFVTGNEALGGNPMSSVDVDAGASASDVLVVMVAWFGSGPTPTVMDMAGSTFAQLAIGSGSALSCALFWARRADATSKDTVTATSQGEPAALLIADYTDVATGAPIDSESAAAGSASPADAGSITTTHLDDTVVALVNVDTGPVTAGPGYSEESMPDFSLIEDRVADTPGSYPATAIVQSTPWCIAAVALEGS